MTSGLYLIHHGIKNQRWGKRNGPPYPLDYNDLSEEEKAAAKTKAVREGNVEEAYRNRSHFTDQELKQTADRYELNKRVSKLSQEHVKTGMQKVDGIMDNVGKITNWMEKGTKAYNAAAKIANSLGDSNLPLIVDGKPKKDITEHQVNTTTKQKIVSGGTERETVITTTFKDSEGKTRTETKTTYAPLTNEEIEKYKRAKKKSKDKSEE